MPAYDSFLDELAQIAAPDGGWGYAPGAAPQLEPTCLALLALSLQPQRHGDVIRRAWAVLDAAVAADGGYRLLKGRDEAIWPTSLVLFTRQALTPGADVARTVAYLLALRGQVPDNPEAGEHHDIDVRLVGWPWAECNFAWVEPTAWAVLALRAAGKANHPRVEEGIRLLLDRAMDSGGINYGNRRVLDKFTDPIPGPTALLLIALHGHHHPRLGSAVDYLLDQLDRDDVDHLSWAKLALDLYRDHPGVPAALESLDDAILAAQASRHALGWLRTNTMRLALTVLALGCGERNFFRLPASSAATPQEAADKAPDMPAASGKQKASLSGKAGSWLRGMAVKALGYVRPLPVTSAVHIASAEDYDADLVGILQDQYGKFREHVPLAGKRVVLKPNLVEYHRDKVINTDPRVVAAAIELCKREGAAEVIVAEGPGHWRNVEFLVRESGLGDVLEAAGVPFVDLNHDEPVKTPNLGLLTGLEYLYLSRTIAMAEVVISLPKLKTHHWAGATLSLKNLFGTLPGICYGWPKNELHWRGIDNSIVDIALTRTPDLAIVDAIVGMEGDGPLNGAARYVGALVMGHDLVAVDATCCRMMQLDPEKIGYLMLGQMKRLGRAREQEIPQLGEKIEEFKQPFATVPHLEALRVRGPAPVLAAR